MKIDEFLNEKIKHDDESGNGRENYTNILICIM